MNRLDADTRWAERHHSLSDYANGTRSWSKALIFSMVSLVSISSEVILETMPVRVVSTVTISADSIAVVCFGEAEHFS